MPPPRSLKSIVARMGTSVFTSQWTCVNKGRVIKYQSESRRPARAHTDPQSVTGAYGSRGRGSNA